MQKRNFIKIFLFSLLLVFTVACGSDDVENQEEIKMEETKEDTEETPVEEPKTDVVEEPVEEEMPVEPEKDKGTKPYFTSDVKATIPEGMQWVKVENMSDEFETTTLDANKWHNNPKTDGFGWLGRPPALFDPENVSVKDGNLNVTTLKYDTPKTVNGIKFTHGGAILRSKNTGNSGMYYECRMKANKTVMSSTFWLSMKQSCNTGSSLPTRKLELDIQECVGRTSNNAAPWSRNFDNNFHSNAFRHARPCDVSKTEQIQGVVNFTEKNHSRYFVYGFWWKTPTDLRFYLDGEYKYSIVPSTDFDIDGYITMAMETYDWNPIDEDSIFETASWDDRTTKYDWVRTWKLEAIAE